MINYNGILLIDKPQGWTSTDVVRKVVRLTHAKVGQMGTLDPMATGVLPVALGKATKLFDTFLTKKKRYIGSFDFGALYDTQDVTGEIVDKSDFVPTREDLERSITKFVGEISQIPPAYSAKKVNGIPAYKLARLKQEFELKPKKLNIYDIKLLEFDSSHFTLDITCSAGTYIRTLGVDIAKDAGAMVAMSALKRIQSGEFKIDDCISVVDLDEQKIANNLISIDEAISFIEPLAVSQQEFYDLKDGKILNKEIADGKYRVKFENTLLGIATVSANKIKLETYLYA